MMTHIMKMDLIIPLIFYVGHILSYLGKTLVGYVPLMLMDMFMILVPSWVFVMKFRNQECVRVVR